MRYLLLLPVVSAGLMLGQEQQAVSNPYTSPADVALGAKTFRSHCATCHGTNGEGGLGPNLANGQFYHGSSDAELLANISSGIPGTEMPGLFFSSDRIWQIVAYLRSLNAARTGSVAGDPQRGAMLVRSSGCLQCHRISGEGGRLGPDLTHAGQTRSAEYLRQSIIDPNADVSPRYRIVSFRDSAGKVYQGFLMNEDTYTVQLIDTHEQLHSFDKGALLDYKIERRSQMPSYKTSLSGSQIQDIVAYLSSLRPDGGSR